MMESPVQKSIPFRLATAALLMLLFGVCIAGAKKKAPPKGPPTLPEQVNALAKQLPGVMLVDAGPILSQIQTLVVDHISAWIADKTPTDVDVRRQLEGIFSLLHYPEEGQPATFAFPWKGQMVIGAGYTLGWTDYDRQNVVAIYTSAAGKSHLATIANFVPRTNLNYEVLPQLAWDDLRFFIYGTRPGKSQQRLTAILYSFDGQNLKPLWQTTDVYDGKLDVDKDKVTIKFLQEDEYIDAVQRGRHPARHLATYQLTANGVQFVEEHEIPF